MKTSALTAFLVALLSLFVSAQDHISLEAAFKSSYSFESSGNYAKAIEPLKKAYDQDSYELNLRLGWLHYRAALYPESMKYYASAIQLKPYSIEARMGYVLPASTAGNWDQVKTKYEEVIRLDKGHYFANYYLGLIYYNRKNYTEAHKNFELLVNLYPFDYDAVHMFAWTNYYMGKLREARVLFQKGLLIRPGDESCTQGLSLIK